MCEKYYTYKCREQIYNWKIINMDISRDVIMITLQLSIIKIAIMNGWSVKRLNEKQIELTKILNKIDDLNEIENINTDDSYTQVFKILCKACNKTLSTIYS